ncbi:MAG: hypothetical protein AAFU64_20000, partial [Bacteroidota bacterium]
EFQQLNSGSPGFLKGRLLYQDKDLALVHHFSEIGDGAQGQLSLLNAQGQIFWEWKADEIEDPYLKTMLSLSPAQSLVLENQIILLANDFVYEEKKIPLVLGLDWEKKQISWKYSPVRDFKELSN